MNLRAVLSYAGTVYHAVQGGSNFNVCWWNVSVPRHFNNSYWVVLCVVLFIPLFKVVLTFTAVTKTSWCYHSLLQPARCLKCLHLLMPNTNNCTTILVMLFTDDQHSCGPVSIGLTLNLCHKTLIDSCWFNTFLWLGCELWFCSSAVINDFNCQHDKYIILLAVAAFLEIQIG